MCPNNLFSIVPANYIRELLNESQQRATKFQISNYYCYNVLIAVVNISKSRRNTRYCQVNLKK